MLLPRGRALRVSALSLLFSAGWSGCGYKVASRLGPAHIKSVQVSPFVNRTERYEVEQFFTQAVLEAFAAQSPFRAVPPGKAADAILQGEITHLTATPVIFGEQTFASTFLVTIIARVELREARTQTVIFSNEDYVFRDEYVLNADVKNFFSEENAALRRIARDFARSVVASVVESTRP